MQRRKSKRHQVAAQVRWRAAEQRAEAERAAGIPDLPLPTDMRDPLDLDLRSYGDSWLRIEPRLSYIAVRQVNRVTGEVKCCALKTALHAIADSLPRTSFR